MFATRISYFSDKSIVVRSFESDFEVFSIAISSLKSPWLNITTDYCLHFHSTVSGQDTNFPKMIYLNKQEVRGTKMHNYGLAGLAPNIKMFLDY